MAYPNTKEMDDSIHSQSKPLCSTNIWTNCNQKGGIQRNGEDTTLTKPLPTLSRSDRAHTMQFHNYATYNSHEMDLRGKIP